MVFFDTNVLVYLQNRRSPFYESSRKLFDDFFSSHEICINTLVLVEFFSIVTDSRKTDNVWSSFKASGYIEKVMASGITILDLDSEIINNALNSTEKYRIYRYGIYDHLIAWTMKHHNIRSIVTANKKDFEKYEFITDIIVPEKNNTSSQVNEAAFIPYGRQSIDGSDTSAVMSVLNSDYLTTGPAVTAFEQDLCDYTGARYCVAVANATAGLHLAVAALNLDQGTEGITSPNTFVASANCLAYNGLKPVFADIDPITCNVDPVEIENRLSSKTNVIIPVHFAGRPCNMERISGLAREKNIHVIEDAAHAIGSAYPDGSKVGCCRYSDMTVFSFHPVKTITTGEGGAITTNSKELYERLLLLRSHGITRDAEVLRKNDGPWYYEQHHLGYNYRLTDIQSALGSSQLKKLESFKARRNEIIEHYNKSLKDIPWLTLPAPDDADSCFHLYVVQVDFAAINIDRTTFMDRLREKGVGTQVHYIPVHTQPWYRDNYGYKEGDFPVAEAYYSRALSLPLFPAMSDDDVDRVVQAIQSVV